jgi:hypothetical protein
MAVRLPCEEIFLTLRNVSVTQCMPYNVCTKPPASFVPDSGFANFNSRLHLSMRHLMPFRTRPSYDA